MSDMLKLPDDPSPGDLFRAIADWYDQNGERMPGTINIHYHATDDDPEQPYAELIAERYGAVVKPLVGATGEVSGTSMASVNLLSWSLDAPANRPTVVLHAYRADRG